MLGVLVCSELLGCNGFQDLSGNRVGISEYIPTTHTHSHILPCVSLYLPNIPVPSICNMYIGNHEFTLAFLVPVQNHNITGFILVFFLSIFVSPFSSSEKSGFDSS